MLVRDRRSSSAKGRIGPAGSTRQRRVREGLVESLNRPGGNATGVNVLLPAMEGKRLGLLREMVPNAALI
jgi:ABC-type uncharacterized transport system substrate-binding protein